MKEATTVTTASKFFDEVANTVAYLYQRWQDESDYEDVEEYRDTIATIASDAGLDVKIGRITNRPFGFTFEADGNRYRLEATDTSVSYIRIK